MCDSLSKSRHEVINVNILRLFIVFQILAVLSLSLSIFAQGADPAEYKVKAAFIYNFAKFVEWPDEPHDNNLTLCVLGEGSFCAAIRTIKGKIISGKRIQIRRINSIKDLKDCNILFIASSEKHNLPHLIDDLDGSRILTVGDTEGFAEQGVIINLYIENDKVRFKINIGAARRANVKLSSKLLKLAKIVTSTPKP